MKAVPSGSFIKEFTLIADEVCEAMERFVIQRPNGHHVVLLSLDDYNDLQRQIYLAGKNLSSDWRKVIKRAGSDFLDAPSPFYWLKIPHTSYLVSLRF